MYCTACGHPTTQKADNLFVCDDQGHENWVNAAPAAGIVIIEGEKVLFAVRAHEPQAGKLDIPGGFLDLSETLEEASLREAKEELGVDIEIIDYLGSYDDCYSGTNKPVINVIYVVKVTAGTLKPSDDVAELAWRSLDDLPTADELGWTWLLEMYPDLKKWYAEHQGLL